MIKTYDIKPTEDQIDTLLLALRYCELNHPSENLDGKKNDYATDFKNLLNSIYSHIRQTNLFE